MRYLQARGWLLAVGALLLLTLLAAAPRATHGRSMPSVAPGLPGEQNAGVEIDKEAWPMRVLPGELVTYTVTLTNTGTVTATLLAITDTLDTRLSFAEMVTGSGIVTPPVALAGSLVWTGPFAVGPSDVLTLAYQATTPAGPGWALPCNSVQAATNGGPVGPARACITVAPATIRTLLPLLARDFEPAWLAVDKTVFPTALVTGPAQVVTFTVSVENRGDSTGTLLSVIDTLPAGFGFQSMAPGSDVQTAPQDNGGILTWSGSWPLVPAQRITLVYRVLASEVPGQYTNQVRVTARDAAVPQAAAVATVEVRPAVLLQEDFDASIGLWTPFLNHHRLEPGQWYHGPGDGYNGSGGLTHDCCTGSEVAGDALMMYLQPGAENWIDYRVETRLYLRGGVTKEGDPEPNSGDPIGLWIRGHYQDSDVEAQWVSGYYVVLVGKSDDPTHLVRIAKMQQPGDCEACLKPDSMYNFNNPLQKVSSAELPGPFDHYRWYTLAVEVRGANIKVFLDGQLVLDWTDPLLPYLSGTVGYKAHETKTVTFDDITVVPLP